MKITVTLPETASLKLYDLVGGETANERALYPDGRTQVDVNPSAYLDAVRNGVARGQALALALGQPRRTVVNGRVTTIDAILAAIRAHVAN